MRSRIALLVFLAACSSSPSDATQQEQQFPALADSAANYFPAATWRPAKPEDVGLDAAKINTLVNDVGRGTYGAIDGVLIIRYGYLVVEKYNNWQPNTAHTMQSVSKSITSLLYGIASQQRPELALDRPIVDVFTNYSSIANNDARKRALTIRHMLSMRTSMDFYEQPYAGSPLQQLNDSRDDWVKFVLDRPMTGEPGTTWAYNSGSPIVMCGAMQRVLGESVDGFARRELFAPIGAVGEWWYQSPYDGLPHCGGGLNLRAQDLARIGYLLLRKGRWGDKQVVPESWIAASTSAYTKDVVFTTYGSDYGYYWWLFPSRPGAADDDIIAASGSGGQWLFVVPKLDLVVAIVASNGAGLNLLYDGVVPAFR